MANEDIKALNRGAFEKAGMLKPGDTPPAAKTPEGSGAGDPPPVIKVPTFDLTTPTPEVKGDPVVTEHLLPPESDDARVSEGERKTRRMMREHIARLETQLKAVKPGVEPEKMKALEDRLAQAHDIIAELDLVRDPRFIETYETPRQQRITELKDTLEEFQADPDLVNQLVGKTRKEQIALLKEGAPDAMSAALNVLDKLNTLDAERTKRLSDKAMSKDEMKRLNAEQEKLVMQQAFGLAFTGLVDTGDILFKEIPGNDKFNANVGTLKQYAVQLAQDNTPIGRARTAALASSGQVYRDLYQKEVAMRMDLERQLRAYGKTLPRSGGAPNDDGPKEKSNEPISPAELARRSAAKMR